MKNPKALFPFLFASSWFGNLILTLLAFYLAFTHDGPLSPLVFITVAVCILSGNLLPITVYFILVRWQEAELKAERTEASVLVRESLRRSEEILGRLDEAEGALAKGILLARQVPERIKESFEVLEGLVDRLNTMEVSSFTESLQAQSEALEGTQAGMEGLKKNLEEIQGALKGLRKDLKDVPDSMAEFMEKALPARDGSDDADVPVNERLDLVYESLESVQDSLDGLLKRMAELQVQDTPTSTTNPVGEVIPETLEEEMTEVDQADAGEEELGAEEEAEESEPPEPTDDVREDRDDIPEEGDDDGEGGLGDDGDFEGEVEFLEPEDREDEPVEEAPVKKTAKKTAKKGPSGKPEESERDAQAEMSLEAANAAEEAGLAGDGLTRIIVHAMVGISNKLFIRGDEPWLSWEDGQQMELIGIGEYAWAIDDLKEPIEVMLMLNDELAAEGGAVQLEPGKTIHVSPRFPKG